MEVLEEEAVLVIPVLQEVFQAGQVPVARQEEVEGAHIVVQVFQVRVIHPGHHTHHQDTLIIHHHQDTATMEDIIILHIVPDHVQVDLEDLIWSIYLLLLLCFLSLFQYFVGQKMVESQ